MAQAVEDWYKQLPIITRSYLTAAIVTTIDCSLEVFWSARKLLDECPEPDLVAWSALISGLGGDSEKINPLVPVDLVIDHSVQVDVSRSANVVQANMDLEFQRNAERFSFLKWGSHMNLEYLGRVDGVLYPGVVGTDSHTTMIDGLGVVGIEAEATMFMFGQPMNMVLPGVVGFKLSRKLQNGVPNY